MFSHIFIANLVSLASESDTVKEIKECSSSTVQSGNPCSEGYGDSESFVKQLAGWNNPLFFYAILSAFIVGMTGIVPLVFISNLKINTDIKKGKNVILNRLLSFGLGSMLGDVFLHLLPESWILYSGSNVAQNGLYVLIGVISFFVLEKVFTQPNESHEVKSKTTSNTNLNNNCEEKSLYEIPKSLNENIQTKNSSTNIQASGYLNLLANAVDNFAHGLAVGSSYLISVRVGVLTTAAILLHEIPHEVGDFAILLRSGFNKTHAAKMQLITASGSVLGAITAICYGAKNANFVLPFTSGGFIYIALSTVVPDLMEEDSKKESLIHMLCMSSAIVIMKAISLLD